MVDILCEINSSLKDKIVHTKNGKTFMFGKLDKAVYGTLLKAILFYEKLAVQLHNWGYIMNPYDTCTFNKMVNSKQITVQFLVDDLHISCKNMDTIDRLIKDLNQKFKTNFQELAITKGKVHDYLGINIDYSNNEYVEFRMYNFLKDVLSEARPDMNGRSKWSANTKQFDVDVTSTKPNVSDQDYFHWMVKRLLFVAKRACPDIQVAVAFLCTQVSDLSQQDYKKLTTVIKYIRETIHLPLLIEWDESGVLTWSVDASFAVHQDMRSHTGAALTMGKGSLISMSVKQKINTKSSTEAELVGVDDAMNFMV